ncbi:AraC family transcriptional regulator [Lapidilactobacillus achengensis]|uniref:AraC family transcriptional regulator n=1 Tax=Lapidilactobacillus achengensis TaxID=2486000 RepID=A0ABW1UTA6_9LACO|nr:AraC family transcriptional regulator [Lapidilactobacillus achengensis]
MYGEELKELEPHGTKLFPLRVHDFCSDPTVIERVATHWHSEFEILVVVNGQGELHLNGASYPLQVGDVAVIQPDQLHAMSAPMAVPFDFYAVVFDPILLQSAVPDSIQQQYLSAPLQVPPVLPPTAPLVAQLKAELAVIQRDFDQSAPAYMLRIKGHLYLVWAILAQLAETAHVKVNSGGIAVELTKTVIAFIQANYEQPLTLSSLATRFNLSKSYLCRIFKRTTKIALTDYINILRITQSTILLKTTTDSISAIASHVGFNNVSYFNKVFHRRLQLTPTEYRRAATTPA